jgi:CRP-like cAMP-binding protein
VARSSSASDAKTKVPALLRAAEGLARRPDDLSLLSQVAATLEELGQKPLAARAFEALAHLGRELGHFAPAAFAVAAIGELGDTRGQKSLGAELARAFCAGSTRGGGKRQPPAPPRARTEPPDTGGKKGAAANDAQAAFKVAGEAIGKSAARARELTAKAGTLAPVALCSALDEAELAKLIAVMEPVRQRAGDVVVDLGDEATSLYLVARGSLTVSRDAEVLARLAPGAFFGEIALLGGTRRTARVVADTDAWLLEIPRDALEAAAKKAPALADVLARHARSRLLANVMRTSEVFKTLDAAEQAELIPRFEVALHAAGAKLVKAGEQSERLHVVVSGEAEVKNPDGLLGRLYAGDVFGEMGLLGRRAASADVVAKVRTVTLSLDRARFNEFAVKHPEVLGEVYKLLISREQANARPVVEVSPEDIVV